VLVGCLKQASLGLRKKGKSTLEKKQTKRQSNGFSRKYRTFYVNVLQGGNTLVRWVKYLSVGAKDLSVGAKNLSVGLPFCCLFFPGIFKKRLGLFSGGLDDINIMILMIEMETETEKQREENSSTCTCSNMQTICDDM